MVRNFRSSRRLSRIRYLFREIYGKEFEATKSSDRIKIQKIIYILKSMGTDYGYKFSWYLRGPYSSSLANDCYKLAKDKKIIITRYALNKNERKNIKKLIELLGTTLKNSNKTELLVSLLFLREEYSYVEDELVTQLEIRKPYYSDSEIGKTLPIVNSILGRPSPS